MIELEREQSQAQIEALQESIEALGELQLIVTLQSFERGDRSDLARVWASKFSAVAPPSERGFVSG